MRFQSDSLHSSMTGPEKINSVENAIEELKQAKDRFANASLSARIQLLGDCIDGVNTYAREWVKVACEAKHIPSGSPFRAEEVTGGPMATIRFLQLLLINLTHHHRYGSPRLPGPVTHSDTGALRVNVVPDKKTFDPWLFRGFKAEVRVKEPVDKVNFQETVSPREHSKEDLKGRICLVLGAGNVSSIPITDTLSKLFLEHKCVLLKMNPVNEYLGPIFYKAFASLIDEGFFQIIYGDAEVGAKAIHHELVDSVHVTGSTASHDAIVWGSDEADRKSRLQLKQPLLTKEITSELGNVTPWIVVPGPYTARQLNFQAQSIAASIVNNASFNCIATKVILTRRQWNQRETFMNQLEKELRKTPTRHAYYPGAVERFKRFSPQTTISDSATELPWTLIRNLDPESAGLYLREESFVCVCVEVALDADSDSDFLKKATRFANEELWGTLGAGITVHPKFRANTENEQVFQDCLDQLEYGVIAINHWVGIAFAMMGVPWGGHPGSSIEDVKSGIGWVHNAYMLKDIEKSILEGPLTVFPKPIWLPSHQNPEPISWRLLDLYHRPCYWNLFKLLMSAVGTRH
ncbi:MAG TPA: aldehyde dehydrogenase family protein [Verrucomicrobiales bacterium]|nr:aldehyde dehydrogenase family protein [Verrucomicrobiales bacterium]HIL72431.1 aldehyde dehydrogenase family protein [Verrucomicrobiota bacterium]